MYIIYMYTLNSDCMIFVVVVILLLKDDELAEVMLGLQSLKLLKYNAFISIDINKGMWYL